MRKLICSFIFVWMFPAAFAAEICYAVHVQDRGDLDWVCNGEMAGTTGGSLRVEAVWVRTRDLPQYAKVCFQLHLANIGWDDVHCEDQVEYDAQGRPIFRGGGSRGQRRQVEAIKIWLQNAPGYGVSYQVHAAEIGWMDWQKDGRMAGTTGQGRRIEAIKVQLYRR